MRLPRQVTLVVATALALMIANAMPFTSSATNTEPFGTVRISFRGCPDGADPMVDATLCTTLLDAPPEALLTHPNGQIPIATSGIEPDADHTYVLTDVPAPSVIVLTGLEPVDYDRFTSTWDASNGRVVDGATDAWHPTFMLEQDEVQEVTVYAWNEAGGRAASPESSLTIAIQGCDPGHDPRLSAVDGTYFCRDDFEPSTIAAIGLWNGVDRFPEDILLADLPRTDDGAYRLDGIAPFTTAFVQRISTSPTLSEVLVEGPAGSIGEGAEGHRVYLGRGQHVHLDVFAYLPSETGGATVNVTIRGCPPGIDPREADNLATTCTTPLDAPETARVSTMLRTSEFVGKQPQFDDGTYEVTGIPVPSTILLVGFQKQWDQPCVFEGMQGISNANIPYVFFEEPGSADIQVYCPDPGTTEAMEPGLPAQQAVVTPVERIHATRRKGKLPSGVFIDRSGVVAFVRKREPGGDRHPSRCAGPRSW